MNNQTPVQDIFQTIALQDDGACHSDFSRKKDGITYTPPDVARLMIRMLNPQFHETIHEPSVGRGVFVFALIEHWLSQGKTAEDIVKWSETHLFVGDIDEKAIKDLKANWVTLFERLNVKKTLINKSMVNFVCTDGLQGVFSHQTFDVFLGNPPYVRFQNLDEQQREALKSNFSSCKTGNVDLYYAFFEDALRRGRRMCYIMPNSWMSNISAKKLRGLALPKIHTLIDFQSRLIFAPVRAYTAIVLTTDRPNPHIRVCDGSQLNLTTNPSVHSVERNDPQWKAERWFLKTSQPQQNASLLSQAADVLSGIATLSDKSFILPNPKVVTKNGQRYVEQLDPLAPHITLRVPICYAPLLLKGTKFKDISSSARILCPYDDNWKIVKEETLNKEAPDLLAWLGRRKTILNGRDKGKGQYEAWYAYGRRQGFWTPNTNEKVIFVSQMGNGALSTFIIPTSKTDGRFLFTSGYVVRPKKANQIDKLSQHIQSSKAWEYVAHVGKGWAGEGEYKSISTKELRNLPYE